MSHHLTLCCFKILSMYFAKERRLEAFRGVCKVIASWQYLCPFMKASLHIYGVSAAVFLNLLYLHSSYHMAEDVSRSYVCVLLSYAFDPENNLQQILWPDVLFCLWQVALRYTAQGTQTGSLILEYTVGTQWGGGRLRHLKERCTKVSAEECVGRA